MNKPRIGVGVMLLKEGKVLLGKRNEDPEKADSELHGEGTWTMPGGKVEFGETLIDACKREVLEETGMRVNKLKLISVADDIIEDAHFITIGFLSDDFEGEPTVLEDDIVEWRWFSLDRLPKNLFFPTKKIIENYKRGRIY